MPTFREALNSYFCERPNPATDALAEIRSQFAGFAERAKQLFSNTQENQDLTQDLHLLSELTKQFRDLVESVTSAKNGYGSILLNFDRALFSGSASSVSSGLAEEVLRHHIHNELLLRFRCERPGKYSDKVLNVIENMAIWHCRSLDDASVESYKAYELQLPEKTQKLCRDFNNRYLSNYGGVSHHRTQELIGIFSRIPEIEACFKSWLELSAAQQRGIATTENISEQNQKLFQNISKDIEIRQGEPIGEFLSVLQGDSDWGIYIAFTKLSGKSLDPSLMRAVAHKLLVAPRDPDDGGYDRFLAAYFLTRFGNAEDLSCLIIEAMQPYGDRSASPLIDQHGTRKVPYLSSYVIQHQKNLAGQLPKTLIKNLADYQWMNTQFYQMREGHARSWDLELAQIFNSSIQGLLESEDLNTRIYAAQSLARVRGALDSNVIEIIGEKLGTSIREVELEAIGDLCAKKYQSNSEVISGFLVEAICLTNAIETKNRWLGILFGFTSTAVQSNQGRLSSAFGLTDAQSAFLLRIAENIRQGEKETLCDIERYVTANDKKKRSIAIFQEGSLIIDAYLGYVQDSLQSEIVHTLMEFGYKPKSSDAELIALLASQRDNFYSSLNPIRSLAFAKNLASIPETPSTVLTPEISSNAVVLSLVNQIYDRQDETRFDEIMREIAEDGPLATQLIEALWAAVQWRQKLDPEECAHIEMRKESWCQEMTTFLSYSYVDGEIRKALVELDTWRLLKSLKYPEIFVNLRENVVQGGLDEISKFIKDTATQKRLSLDNHKLFDLLFIQPEAFKKIIQEAGAGAITEIVIPQTQRQSPDDIAKLANITQRLKIISRSEPYCLQIRDLESHGGGEFFSSALTQIPRLSSADVGALLNYSGLLLSAAHMLGDKEALVNIEKKLESRSIDNIREFEEAVRPAVLLALSSIFPKRVISRVPLEKIADLAQVYVRYSRELEKREQLPWMQAAAVAEMKGLSLKWKNGDPKTLAIISQALKPMFESRYQLEGMMKTRKSILEQSPVLRMTKAGQKEWKRGLAMHAHVIRDVAVEDILKSLDTVIEQFCSPQHVGDYTRRLIGAARSSDVLRNLSVEIRQLMAKAPHLSEGEGVVLKELLRQQKLLTKWQPVWWLLNKASDTILSQLDQMMVLRRELACARELIEEMGFDFRDSFAVHTYLGELDILREKISEPKWQDEKYKEQRDIVVRVLEQWSERKRDADACVGNIRSIAERALVLFRQKEAVSIRLLESDPHLKNLGTKLNIWKTMLEELDFLEVAEPASLAVISEVLMSLQEPDAIRDLEALISMSSSEERSAVLMYRPVYEFSKALRGFVGQCLDYRAGSNCKSNLAWNELHVEPVVAFDPNDIARANCLFWVGEGKEASSNNEAELPYLGRRSFHLEENNTQGRAILVMDPVYSPDGSVVSWGKIEGALSYGIQRAHSCGVDFLVPDKVVAGYEVEIEDFIKSQGLEAGKNLIDVKIVPGANGSIYLESVEWCSYESITWNRINGWSFPCPKAETTKMLMDKTAKVIAAPLSAR